MEDYKKLARELIEDHINDCMSWDSKNTRQKVLENLLEDTADVFGNVSGSRTCSTYEAQQFLNKSGAIWDEDIHELFADIETDYFESTLARGAETLDVVILELLAPQIIDEMLEEAKEEA